MPFGWPGIGVAMDGAMQQAAQAERQEKGGSVDMIECCYEKIVFGAVYTADPAVLLKRVRISSTRWRFTPKSA